MNAEHLLGVIAVMLFMQALHPNTQTPDTGDTSYGFDLSLRRYNQILEIQVQKLNSRNPVWRLCRDISYADGPTRFSHIDYGKAPHNMRERIPAEALKPGDKIVLYVKYQYDTIAGACVTELATCYIVIGENQFRNLKDVPPYRRRS
jgi:hypothetical protein